MGLRDTIDNAAEKLAGKSKEAAGKSTDDPALEAEGRATRSKRT